MTPLRQPRLTEIVAAASEAACDAGRVIEAVRASASVSVTEKSDSSPVTLADHQSDQLLHERLQPLVADAAWLSEESVDDTRRVDAEWLWVVDPLDGTKEFIAGVPQYAVAIALCERGEPVLGIVHNPTTGDLFSAIRGQGALKNGARVAVAENGVMLASRSEVKRGEFDVFDDWAIEPIGSIALKLALVASGHGAVTLSRGPKWEWDVCAGSLLVTEAGGRATDMFGQPLRFNNAFPKVKGILAGAPGAVERALGRLREVGGSDRMAELAG